MNEQGNLLNLRVAEPDRRVYLAVMHDGEVVWKAPRQPRITLYAANLVILSESDGTLLLWKERFNLVTTGILVTPHQVGVLAAAHVVLTSEEAQRDFGAYLVSVRRQTVSAMKLLGEQGYNKTMADKNWTGKLSYLQTVAFSRVGKKKATYPGIAVLYTFEPDDKRCKVTCAAVVTGVPVDVMCGSGGDVGDAILRAAGLCDEAKNCPSTSMYDSFPDPIGRPASHLGLGGVHAIVFYKK